MPKVFIEVMGGVVTGVYADNTIECYLIDYDNDPSGSEGPQKLVTEDLSLIEVDMLDEPVRIKNKGESFMEWLSRTVDADPVAKAAYEDELKKLKGG